MICPIDLTQMVQKDKLGAGVSTDDVYETWMVLECPNCGRAVREQYICRVLTEEQVNLIKNTK